MSDVQLTKIYMENRFKDGMKSVMAFIMEHTPNILSLLIP